MRKFALLLLFALLPLALSCGDTDPTDPLKAGAPSDLVSDAHQNQGNKGFFWLAPVVKNNTYDGVFNPQLKPWVVICELDTSQDPDVCNPSIDTLAQWTLSTGLQLSTTDEHYGFEWHTDQTATNFEATYRIQVYLTEGGETLLGYADVQFFNNGQELKNINTDDVIELRDGRTLPGRFRIEKGASCDAQTDCGEAMIGPDGGTVTTEAGFAGTELPAGAVDGDILIKIRRIDPTKQPWGRCLPTGLRQEEGCYEFDTEPAIGEVNQQDAFNTPVLVGVCIDPQATRPEKLALHKYDPEKPTNGVVKLDASPETFLSCDGFAFQEEPSGFFGRFAAAARRLLRPVASMITVRELYATDEGRGGVTDSYSFIGWAEPVDLTLSSAPLAVLPATAVPATARASTSHNHPDTEPAVDASGHTLRFNYTDPTGQQAVLDSVTTDSAGQATPAWTLTEVIGVHSVTVTTQLQIVVDGAPFLVPDPTTPLTITVGGYQTAEACEGETDCGQAIVDDDGATVTTENGFAGTDIPAGALDAPVLITIRRVNPESQLWGDCLPTGLRQEEGCYEFDTEPALSEVNAQDAFNTNVTVAVCLDPQAVRADRLTLHKFDPEKPAGGVVELAGAAETFLTCDSFAYNGDTGLLGRFARGARRLLSPVADMVIGTPLYATDEGRGGVTDSYSFIGWAEPVELTAADVPVAVLPSTAVPTTIGARTAHNHGEPMVNASGHTLRIVYTDPAAAVSGLPAAVTDTAGQASPSWTLTGAVGVHTLAVSTRMVVEGVEIPDPTSVLTVAVGGFTSADACDNDPDCGQAVVDETGDTVKTSTGFAGTVIPPGALDGAVLVTIRRIDPDQQPWGDCLPTGLRQEEGCYEFDTEPALSDVNQDDKFNVNVEVAVCLDPTAVRADRLTLHKFDPDKPAGGVVELAGAAGDFITCDAFAAIPSGLFERLAQAGRRLLGPVARHVGPSPLYASLTDEGRGGVTDSYSFIGWAEPITLALRTEPNAADQSITDVVVSAETAHNHGLLPEPADGATLRFEHTDPSGNVTVTELPTTLIGSVAEARIPLTSQGGAHNVRVSTQEEIIIDSDLLIISAAGAPGLFAAPRITLVGEPTPFLVPDPTVAIESGPLTVLGLVSRWDADDLAAPFADRVGPNHGRAQPTGSAVDPTVTGVQGNGFSFDGSGGEMVAPANHIGAADRFTVAAWVKLDPTGSPLAIQRFVTLDGEKAVLRQEAASTDVARQAHFYGHFGPADPTGASLVHIRESNALLEGCWQHVAGTYDGQQIAFYRDGTLIAAMPVPAEDQDASAVAQRVVFGFPGTEALHGTLDEVEVHNHALSQTEVGALAGAFTPACNVTTGSAAGRVIDAATGEPLPSAQIVVAGTTLGTLTNADGFYRLLNVPAGTQTIRAEMIGYEAAEQIVEVTAAQFVGVEFSLSEATASALTLPFRGNFTDGVIDPEFDVGTTSENIAVTETGGALRIASQVDEKSAFARAVVPSSSFAPLTATQTQPLAVRVQLWSGLDLGIGGHDDSYARLQILGGGDGLSFGMKGASSGPEGVHYSLYVNGANSEHFLSRAYDAWNHDYTIIYDGSTADLYFDGTLLASPSFAHGEFAVALNAHTPSCCVGGVNANFTDFVIRNAAVTVELTQTNVSLLDGEATDVDARGLDASGAWVGSAPVRWASSNPAVATVSADGLITAVGAGTATITARVDGVTGQAAVTVQTVETLALYGVNSADDGLSVIDPATGGTTFIGPLDPNDAVYTTPIAMAVRPSDQKVFVWNNSDPSGVLLTVDVCTGLAARVNPDLSGQGTLGALAFSPDGRLFGVNQELVEIDPATGATTSIGALGRTIAGADFDDAGTLYGVDLSATELVTIDITTAAVTVVAGLSNLSRIGSVVFDPTDATNTNIIGSDRNLSELFDLDKGTGTISNRRQSIGGQGLGFAPGCKQ